MTFDVHAVSDANFTDWVSAVKSQGGELDTNAYTALMKPSHADAPRTFAGVEPGLFDHAVMATMRMEGH
jgi:cytochrome o ubiquinol oxidase subunit 2